MDVILVFEMLYCAYGSNLHPGRLGRRVPSARLVGTEPLRGWALRFNKRGQDGSAKCRIHRAVAASVVYVAVYDLSDKDLAVLDRMEGVGAGYRHFELQLPDHGRVLTYLAQDDYIDDALLPFEWYKHYVLAGCRYHGFDSGYTHSIERHPHCADPDRPRHIDHMARIGKLTRNA